MTRALLTLMVLAAAIPAGAASFEVNKGDHICIIGNTLAERMQHHGWLETRLHSRFPDYDLVFRNLGYSGDEIELAKRLRSMDFGTLDQWLSGSAPIPQPQKLTNTNDVRQNRFELTNTRADVIFAFFGYNESFAGAAGLENFKKNLDALLKQMHSQKYNGTSAPRIVLFSPIAHENTRDRNLPDGSENNARLKLYTAAMGEVARANDISFADLFTPSLRLFAEAKQPLTINGIHLTEEGDSLVAAIIEAALFPDGPQLKRDAATLDKLHRAVLDKNFFWFNRYRATDGYSTYGDRAFLKFVDGQTNYEVVQRELEVIDILTSNRDKRVWAVARGSELKIEDSNLPPFIPVKTNKPGPLEGGKHVYLGGEEAIGKMTIHKGMKVQLFASEEMFPEVVNPVQMAFDVAGRLWVAAWPTYPHWKPTESMNDKLLILEDTNGDGKADKCTTFVDDLHNPTGFEFWNGGVLVARGPDLLFLKDTNGDDKADIREILLHGLDTADTHHTANSFVLDPGGALYFQEGTFHHTQVESPWGPPRRVANGAVFRFEPRAQKFSVYVSHGFANPHGHAFDRWGQDIVVDGTGANPYHAALFSGHIDFPQKHNRPPQVYPQRTRPCPAIEFLSSGHFPPENQGNLLVGNVIGFQGILQYKIQDQDSSFSGTEVDPIVYSTDPNFRPSDLEIGPDGALYFTDWQNPIIGHMQHNLRDPSRGKTHGRVYRVTYEGRPLLQPDKPAGEFIDRLLDRLKDKNDRARYRARIELSGRSADVVLPALKRWVAALDRKDTDFAHHQLEALWIHQHHNVVNNELLVQVLSSPEFQARAAAVRVLCYWRDRVPAALEILKRAAADENPRVRLEAVRAASFFDVPEALEVVLVAAELPSDKYLDFLRAESTRTLQPLVDRAKAENRKIAFTTAAGTRYNLRNMSTDELLKQERTRDVYGELLYRPGLQDAQRREVVAGLAKFEGKPEPRVIMESIESLDRTSQMAEPSLVFDLVRQLTGRNADELVSARVELEKLATSAKQPLFRQIGYVSLINVDGTSDKAWKLAGTDVQRLQDFANAVPLISDPGVRASLYDRIEPLLYGLPSELAKDPRASAKGVLGRTVRIELPRRGTLTLAEVEVMSGGRNVARQGKAFQKNTSNGGDAKRAIDGNTSAAWGDGSQTHSEENTNNPWWEVDLGSEYPIEAVAVYNRAEGELFKRLEGFTLKVLDPQRSEVFELKNIPAPNPMTRLDLGGGGSAAKVRQAAMQALTQIRGQETKTFETLAKFVRDDVDRTAAIRALQKIPRASWPKEQAAPLLKVLVESLRKTPATERTLAPALDALEFADSLATLLPADEAKQTRAALGELGVRVIRIGTLFERMSYDQDAIAVSAGKPVEFLLDNSDLMPHNFVIVAPGALEEVGLMAEASAQQPSFAARQFVPQSPKVLLSSTLLQPRDSQKLPFVAPTEPGVYPFVCTYPGHWRRMYGALYVVKDLDAYLANPEAYLAANPLPIKDELLKDRRPRTEWKFADLASAVEHTQGRSYAAGKQMFTVAACVACHRVEGQGNQFGADLTKLDPKSKPVDVLKDVLEPSFRINEKFQAITFVLASGKVLTGLVLEETPQSVKVIENPLAKAEPIEIQKSDIEERKVSTTSIMPKGLLDKLSRDEILDLIAYVSARGDKNNKLFQTGGHDHGHGH